MILSRPLILASSSPRRKYLMEAVGFTFRTEKPDVEETFPDDLPVSQVARFLATAKARYFRERIGDDIVVTADTVVILGNSILNKPADRAEAIAMLSALSGNTHRVMTGVTILTRESEVTFDETTDVTFQKLKREQIEFYVDQYHPYDKAGSYGAQESLPPGMNPCSPEERKFLTTIGKEHLMNNSATADGPVLIRQLAGSFFNVMGLPVHKLFSHLQRYA